MLTQELKEISQDQAYIFQDRYFESYQIHQLTIIYRFEDTNQENLLNFLFQNLHSFWVRIICISNMFHI